MLRTRVGYAGGTQKDPTYRRIGDHTEVFQVDYDPAQISFGELLDQVWASHDPCRRAWSSQYESIVFYSGAEEERVVRESAAKIGKQRGRPVLTDIRPAARFYFAEDYHQKYALRGSKSLYRPIRAMFDSEREFAESTVATKVNAHLSGYLSLPKLRVELAKLGLEAVGERSLENVVVAQRRESPAAEAESRPTSRPAPR